jgi:hypothetical protein
MVSSKVVLQKLKSLWSDESAQGATEYILLIVIVVGLTMMFKGKIMEIVKGKLEEIGGDIGKFKPE